MILDAIEDSDEKARCPRRLGRLCHIVVVHLAVTRRVAKCRMRASEQCQGSFLLCLHRRGPVSRPLGPKALVIRSTPMASLPGPRAWCPDLYCPHGRDDSLEAAPPGTHGGGPAVSRASLQADLLAAQERAARMHARITQLERRLSELLGEQAWPPTPLPPAGPAGLPAAAAG